MTVMTFMIVSEAVKTTISKRPFLRNFMAIRVSSLNTTFSGAWMAWRTSAYVTPRSLMR